ncbi:MAG: cell division ATP-binding protein FtsE [Bdellovibrionaceae bacterium]|jgi:cell division transport system ATP-binding protein|nr:cell division ATP-binding protein FtsE [Pseudobdellovibrionaceae bacterium]
MINFTHVYKTYSENINALKNVNLEVSKGEFVFLTGSSGAGKTTLFRLISAYDQASSGDVVVANYDLAKISQREIPYLRRKIGVVYQDFKLLKDRTVFENIALPLEILGEKDSYIQKRVNQMLSDVNLEFKKYKYPAELSGGEQQRVAIARALVHHPGVLIADEPTGNLDPDLTEEIINLLEKVNAQGTTVFIATHDHEMVKRRNKRTLCLHQGVLSEGGNDV